jgi:hypothetical protein
VGGIGGGGLAAGPRGQGVGPVGLAGDLVGLDEAAARAVSSMVTSTR